MLHRKSLGRRRSARGRPKGLSQPFPGIFMRRLAVFLAASNGHDPAHAALAASVGTELARQGIGLVYGGGRRGLMGVVADSALKAGGEVIGVMPRSMVEREWAHEGVTELLMRDSMHERKALMAERADAFVALPGGLGTLEGSSRCGPGASSDSTPSPSASLTPEASGRRCSAPCAASPAWLPPRIHSGRPRRCPRSARLAGGAARAAPQHPAARARSESAVAEQVCGAAGSTRMPSAC